MGLSAQSVKKGSATSSTEHISKDGLVGSLIAFSVNEYDPKFASKFGTQPKVDVDLLVIDGESAGLHDTSWITYGNLARQLGEQGDGTFAGRVTSGPGAAPGSTWYGCDFDVSDSDMKKVREAILALGNSSKVETEEAPF